MPSTLLRPCEVVPYNSHNGWGFGGVDGKAYTYPAQIIDGEEHQLTLIIGTARTRHRHGNCCVWIIRDNTDANRERGGRYEFLDTSEVAVFRRVMERLGLEVPPKKTPRN